VDRLNILTRHQRPAFVRSAFAMQDAIDIVANEVGVDLEEPDAFAARVTQGVRDTNAEALIAPTRGITNTGDAFKSSREWIAMFSAESDSRRRTRHAERGASARRARFGGRQLGHRSETCDLHRRR